ncbi:MAG TPA: alpha/beta hydrolase [Chloroflexi bacterium]|nr:alpha/beta hydrolase [Chloroflexota bacterium]
MTWFDIVAIVVLFIILGLSYYFARIIIFPKVYPYEEVYQIKVDEGTLNTMDWATWPKEEIWIESPKQYQLHGYWLPVEEAVGTVIIVHGITVNLYASVKYVKLFRRRGFNVLVYDHRNHGKSGGNFTTFGFLEKRDLKAVVDWVVRKTGHGAIIGTHGESLGAATCLQHAAIDPRVSFVISDCSFADLADLLYYRLRKEYRLMGWILIPIASVFVRFMAGFWLQAISPVKAVQEIEAPLFIIHGAEDEYIPPSHAERIFASKKKGVKKLWLALHSDHAESQPVNPTLYDQKIGEFLSDIMGPEFTAEKADD